MLEHGGRLLQASRTYNIPLSDWLDLSTGVSPYAWPVPPIPPLAWQRLPDDDDGLIDVARDYYEATSLLPLAGSQAAIQCLPMLRATTNVGVLAPGYAEHAHAWRRQGHRVTLASARDLIAHADHFDVIVLMHPNNPAGDRFTVDELLALHASLAARGGWLIVDEAFIDATPEHSLCPYAGREGLIVLRSVGKFFGMAGARAGFAFATMPLLDALRERLGPWTLSGPTRHVLKLALADDVWQAGAGDRLHRESQRLARLLTRHGLPPTAGTAFFQWCCDTRALNLHWQLAQRGVFTRWFETPQSLRFGLPGDDAAFERLDRTLAEVLA
ncbi:threonine-phosphate decarboxylase CobD [Dyella sp. GSA-30]|uniref:threonine-phosphate decarboxylase CobD n=1 Tax=Dyella sp. GSA-30 TaxID=2994496 RepID=UPI002491B201|nr:threonine-phosphate decarboxylase CobD [Dyella sp. GSA-30]BDU23111.1 threonine-phosphate decarboxylase [Dyella sp. GSA-30]